MIYFITDGRYTKIGKADDPEKRLKELQTGNPFPLTLIKSIDGSFEEESNIHKSLSIYRMNGEWFDFNCFDDEVIEFLLDGECGYAVKRATKWGNKTLREINKQRSDKTKSQIKGAIDYLFSNSGDFITANLIKDGLDENVSLSTVRRYMEVFKDEIDRHNKKVFGTDNFVTYKKTLSLHKIKRAIKVLNEADERLSRRRVAKEAGVHFNTVQNLWDDEEIQKELDKFNELVK